jgi:hypothetical protein
MTDSSMNLRFRPGTHPLFGESAADVGGGQASL